MLILVETGSVVPEKKAKMWKVYRTERQTDRRTDDSDQKSPLKLTAQMSKKVCIFPMNIFALWQNTYTMYMREIIWFILCIYKHTLKNAGVLMKTTEKLTRIDFHRIYYQVIDIYVYTYRSVHFEFLLVSCIHI